MVVGQVAIVNVQIVTSQRHCAIYENGRKSKLISMHTVMCKIYSNRSLKGYRIVL